MGLMAGPAWAGNEQRNRWEGVAIGLGAAILGSAFLNQQNISSQPSGSYYPRSRKNHHRQYDRHRSQAPVARGYWEIRKVWVAPVYEKVWNPGHYNRKGRWMEARWIRVERSAGYWEKQRVWVAGPPVNNNSWLSSGNRRGW